MTDTQVRDPSLNTPGPGRLLAINGPGLKELVKASLAWLKSNQQAINLLNVFPVPDGDTGTNMLLTLRSVIEEADRAADATATVMAKAMSHS